MTTPPDREGSRPRLTGWFVAAITVVAVVVASAVTVLVLVSTLGADPGDEGPDAVATSPPADTHLGASEDGYAVWEVNDDGLPVRFDPCTPIEVAVAADGGPVPAADLLADVEAALADLAEASGLRFAPVVTTDERPAADRDVAVRDADGGWRWAPVLVAWADPHEAGLPLRDVDRGIGAPVAIGPSGARVYVTGQVVLNRRRTDLVAGRDDRATSWGATVLHELAHVVGLDHVDDPAQLMATYPGQGPVELADGDRAGLAAVGADGGCLEVPPARPVQVPAPTP